MRPPLFLPQKGHLNIVVTDTRCLRTPGHIVNERMIAVFFCQPLIKQLGFLSHTFQSGAILQKGLLPFAQLLVGGVEASHHAFRKSPGLELALDKISRQFALVFFEADIQLLIDPSYAPDEDAVWVFGLRLRVLF